MPKTDKELFTNRLLNSLREFTGCGIQHKKCPCNNCFHTFAEDELKLSPEFAHNLWEIVLILRGDYTEEMIKKYREVKQ